MRFYTQSNIIYHFNKNKAFKTLIIIPVSMALFWLNSINTHYRYNFKVERKKLTIDYIKSIGIASDYLIKNGYDGKKDYFYEIELEETPSIINTLKLCGYFEKNKRLDIIQMSQFGITFYLVEQYMRDGYLFVPISNIVSIHTIDKINLEGLITQRDRF